MKQGPLTDNSGDFLDPASLPEDLAWVPAHYRLHPDDPVYLLLAWHWRRVQRSEDTVQAAIVEMRAILDARVAEISEAVDTVEGVSTALGDVQAALEEKPKALAEQLDGVLTQPLADALARAEALGKNLEGTARAFQASQQRQLLAALLVGVTLGVLSALIVLFA